jgi:hypothetical protein
MATGECWGLGRKRIRKWFKLDSSRLRKEWQGRLCDSLERGFRVASLSLGPT